MNILRENERALAILGLIGICLAGIYQHNDDAVKISLGALAGIITAPLLDA